MTKQDIIEASGPLQVCAGLKSGAEAAIHAMHGIFNADDADAVLLIDASNAFNSLNRAGSPDHRITGSPDQESVQNESNKLISVIDCSFM